MKIAIVHDAVPNSSAPDVRDVISQAEAAGQALKRLGHECCRLECSLNLADVQKELIDSGADLVFNLVESISGKGRLIHLFPFCLDALEMPYTGARAEALMLTSNKIVAKQWMDAAGIPSPQWIGLGTEDGCQGFDNFRDSGPWIIKSVWEHASIGLGRESLVDSASKALLRSMLQSRAALLGGDCFAEGFIEGREFNLSLLAGPSGPHVLPPAEILFESYTKDMPRIVDYRTKWDDTAYEYHHTPRRFDFDESDQIILKTLKAVAIRCWKHFGLSGYARVDFRVDLTGNPWVLEINANPCLSPDAGFAAALERAGIPYTDAIERIIEEANHLPAEPVGTRSLRNKNFKERMTDVVFFDEPAPPDVERIRQLVETTGFFSPEEVDVAGELVAERIAKGPESGYEFVMADHYGRLIGYTCFGPIPCTTSSYDLYWVAVHPDFQELGLGGWLITEAEKRIKESGGTQIYLDTSQRVQYNSTRHFYESCGYRLAAVLKDFYAAGDGKAIYVKWLV